MIPRTDYLATIQRRLKNSPVVSLLGPRQVGKTTLAKEVAAGTPSHYFDVEQPQALERLREPSSVLEPLRGLVVIDEIQRMPELFPLLRVLADRRPLPARFLILGSASPNVVRGVSESLAGRAALVDLGGLNLSEVGAENHRQLWWRGGFPPAYLARTDQDWEEWQTDFIRLVLERDLPQLGVNIPAATLLRFWRMVAHCHGAVWNSSEPARSMGVAETTVKRYLDLLSGMYLVRLLPPWFENLGKRQVKAPKAYIRDSGMLHGLLHLASPHRLEEHPKLGASWEGFAMEQVLQITGDRDAYFWATHGGAELDLMVLWQGRRIGFEFKFGDAPGITKSMHVAMADLKLDRLLVVVPGKESYDLGPKVEVVSIMHLVDRLATELKA
jgi:uncharacterized protein